MHIAVRIVLTVISVFAALMLIVLLLDALPWAPRYRGENHMRISAGERVHIVPHGGAKLLFPENTILSYEEMHERQWNTFEVDLCLTADGQLITHHDLDLEGSAGLSGTMVRDLSYAELAQYNFGVNFVDIDGNMPYAQTAELTPALRDRLVPARLEDLFSRYPNNYYILELKDTVEDSGALNAEAAVMELIRVIEAYGMQEKVVVSSFDDQVTEDFRERTDNSIPTGAATTDTLMISVLSAFKLDFFLRPEYTAVMLPIRDTIQPTERAIIELLPGGIRDELSVMDEENDIMYTNLANQRMVDDAHRKNLAVYFWTINDPQEMIYLIELGVDGIITDRPDILADLLVEIGM